MISWVHLKGLTFINKSWNQKLRSCRINKNSDLPQAFIFFSNFSIFTGLGNQLCKTD